MSEKSFKEKIVEEFKKLKHFEERVQEFNALKTYLIALGFTDSDNLELVLNNNELEINRSYNTLDFNADGVNKSIYIRINKIDKSEKELIDYKCNLYLAFKPFLKSHKLYEIFENDDSDCECSEKHLVFDEFKHFSIKISQYVCEGHSN